MVSSSAVIIPVHNGAAFIENAVLDALAQTCKPDVIVVDDASSDDTAAIARRAGKGSSRLRLLQAAENIGPAAARNLALDQTEADWIGLLDADDRMAPDRLERLVAIAEARGWDMAADDILRIRQGGRPDDAYRHWRDEDFGELVLDAARFIRENNFHHCGHGRELGFLKPVFRRRLLVDHDLRYNPDMRLGEDFDLYLRALLCGARFGLVDPLGYTALDRDGSLSKRHAASALEQICIADRKQLKRADLSRDVARELRGHLRLHHKKWAWVRLIEAVKAGRPKEMMACFAAPPGIGAYLAGKLWERLRHGRGPAQG